MLSTIALSVTNLAPGIGYQSIFEEHHLLPLGMSLVKVNVLEKPYEVVWNKFMPPGKGYLIFLVLKDWKITQNRQGSTGVFKIYGEAKFLGETPTSL